MIQPFSFCAATGGSNGYVESPFLGLRDFVSTNPVRASMNLVSGVLRNLTLTLNAAPGASGSFSFTLYVNGVATACVLTFTGSDVTQRWTGADIPILVGESVYLKLGIVGTPVGYNQILTQFEVESTFAGQSQYHRQVFVGVAGSGYCGVFSQAESLTSGIVASTDIAPTSGYITKMGYRGEIDNGPDQIHSFTVVVNGVDRDVFSFNTTGGNVAEISGDLNTRIEENDRVYIRMDSTGGRHGGTLSVRFQADIDGESIFATVPNINLANGQTEYFYPTDPDALNVGLGGTDRNLRGTVTPFRLGKLHTWLSAAPSTGKSRVVTVRRNSADTSVTLTLADAETVKADNIHGVAISDGDGFSLQQAPVSTPATTSGAFSMVAFIEPPSDDEGGDGGGGGGGGGGGTEIPAATGYVIERLRMRRERIATHLSAESVRTFFRRLELDFEAGVGRREGLRGDDPQIILSWSDDGGHTWEDERPWRPAGKRGAYRQRAVWSALGASRDRVFRIVVDAPVKWRLFDMFVDADKGRH